MERKESETRVTRTDESIEDDDRMVQSTVAKLVIVKKWASGQIDDQRSRRSPRSETVNDRDGK